VRVLPRKGETVVDGGAEGLAGLAAFGQLDPSVAVRYAADATPAEIRAASDVVITDSNRRQAIVAARTKANRGRVLTASESLSEDGAMLDPFARGADAQTVTRLSGVKSLWSPFSPQTTQFPEHRPFAALDGDEATAWVADRGLDTGRHWMEVKLDAPRRIGDLELRPYSDSRGVVEQVEVNGRIHAVRDGWNTIALNQTTDTIRIRIAKVRQPPGLTGGAGGIRELRIPGVKVAETLRPPVLAERALDASFRGTLAYLFERFTVDAPFRSTDADGEFQTALLRDRQDPERVLRRTISPPARRKWAFGGWLSVGPRTGDDDIDRLAGTRGPKVTSSGRYEGRATHRGSRAFDGNPGSAWIAPYDGRPAALTVTLDDAVSVSRLKLVPDRSVRVPRQVRITAGGDTLSVPVADDGTVALPRPVRGDEIRIVVERASFAPGRTGLQRQRRAVGIAEVEGITGARVHDADPLEDLRGRCGDATVETAAGPIRLEASGEVADLDGPIQAKSCEFLHELPAGPQEIAGGDGVLRIDKLLMTTPSPDYLQVIEIPAQPDQAGLRGLELVAPAASKVLDPGRDDQRGARDGVKVSVDEPAWLVLGEGYNRGWRATCDGKDLGEPQPIQGFANGWKVDPGCTDVAFAWAPNKVLLPAYILSAIGCLFLLVVFWRRRSEPAPEARALLPDDAPDTRWPLPRALAAGVAAGLVLGFVFALRAGIVIGPAVFLILWRGVSARQLALAGGAVLAVGVPLAYLLIPVDDLGGYNTNLSVERIDAHWVGVAGVVLLGAALCRSLAAARASHPDRPRLLRRRRGLRAPVPR
jgi:arabinofuranan 3-O-arabinosyltransferase